MVDDDRPAHRQQHDPGNHRRQVDRQRRTAPRFVRAGEEACRPDDHDGRENDPEITRQGPGVKGAKDALAHRNESGHHGIEHRLRLGTGKAESQPEELPIQDQHDGADGERHDAHEQSRRETVPDRERIIGQRPASDHGARRLLDDGSRDQGRQKTDTDHERYKQCHRHPHAGWRIMRRMRIIIAGGSQINVHRKARRVGDRKDRPQRCVAPGTR